MNRFSQGPRYTLLATALFAACTTLAHAASAVSADAQAASNAASLQARRAVEEGRKADFVAHQVNRSHVRRSFTGLDGHRVQCVDIDAQPAVDHPALAGQPVLRRPVTLPPSLAQDVAKADVAAVCPDETVPVREVTLDDLAHFETLDAYFEKRPGADRDADGLARHRVDGEPTELPLFVTGPDSAPHEYAHAAANIVNEGVSVNINIWKPFVEATGEFSLGQQWLSRGSFNSPGKQDGTLQTLEAGVQVSPQRGDYLPHLFIYSTRDAYNNLGVQPKGCYDGGCHDFVKVSNKYFPGMVLSASVAGGTQTEVKVEWYKDGDAGHWWLNVNGEWVGYYPNTLYQYSGLLYWADRVDFGGEIVNLSMLGGHTGTDMGSGKFPSAGFKNAAYMRNLQYLFWNSAFTAREFMPVTGLTRSVTNAKCYDIGPVGSDVNWGTYFFYGGPGYSNPDCLH